MGTFETYSKRQKRLSGDAEDVYRYDRIPDELKIQIVHIWNDVIGIPADEGRAESITGLYSFICKTLSREYGTFSLWSTDYRGRFSGEDEVKNFLLKTDDIGKNLDVIELTFRLIDRATRNFDYLYRTNADQIATESINELNARFKEHGIGFRYEDGEIVRVDSEFIHVEAVKPALLLLRGANYSGAQEEFLGAFEHYRHGKNKEALNDCLKAFESTMKAICQKQGWAFKTTDTAKNLIQICFEKQLIPDFWQTQFASLRSMLESSVPTGRNKLSGHGQGPTPVAIPDYLTAYMLHMTASSIVFLCRAEQELP